MPEACGFSLELDSPSHCQRYTLELNHMIASAIAKNTPSVTLRTTPESSHGSLWLQLHHTLTRSHTLNQI